MARYWDDICKLQQKQVAKGIQTYGQTLEENTLLDFDTRVTMLEEELIDALQYLEHLRAMYHEEK